MGNVSIDTTQQVQIDYEIAGIGDRIFAYIIDAFIVLIYAIIFFSWAAELLGNDGLFVYFLIFLPILFYHLLFEFFLNGQSFGKRALGIKVVMKDGTRPGIGSFLIRWVMRLFEITGTSGMVAILAILINGQGQRLGDMAGGTTVIKTQKATSFDQTMMSKIDVNYEPHYQAAAELTDKDVGIIKDVLNARNEYDRSTYFTMLLKAQNRVAEKLGLDISEDTEPQQFLQTIVKDYNVIHGQQV